MSKPKKTALNFLQLGLLPLSSLATISCIVSRDEAVGTTELALTTESEACGVTYRVLDSWNDGFNGEVLVSNNSPQTMNGWQLGFRFQNGERINSSWRSVLQNPGPNVSVKNESYNGRLAPGATETFGFTASGKPGNPSGFSLNGASCSGDGGAPPSPSPSPSPPPQGGQQPSSGYGKLVLDENFNHRSGSFSNYTYDMASADFGGLNVRSSGEVRGFDGNGKSWPADNRVGNGVLRADYPKNRAGGTNTGFLFDKKFQNAAEATLEYSLRFEGVGANNEFFWAAGGKLPGLGGSARETGIPVGCTTDRTNIENGFSARLMWRRRGDLVVYTYFPDRTSSCGVDHTFLTGARANTWYKVRQHIVLNTPGQRNGVLEMFVDGKRTLHLTNVLYRLGGKNDVSINDVLFHTYRGGSESDTRFHSPNDDHVQFDDFKVWVK